MLLFAALIAGSAIPVVAKRQVNAQTQTPTQRFICNIGYTEAQCRARTDALRAALQKYPIHALGDWTWVVVHSNDWKIFLADRHFSPNTPAVTYLPARETYFDEALLLDTSSRGVELSTAWHLPIPALLDVAIRHEMGHALCNNPAESAADHTAALLRSGAPPVCALRDHTLHPPITSSLHP
jgi:hypothetical protein